MEIHSEYVESTASALSYENVNFSKGEDSGYHTFTPGSLDCGEISRDYLDQSVSKAITSITGQIQIGYFQVTPEVNIHLSRRYAHSTTNNESVSETPPYRRACKRPHSSTTEKLEGNSVPTPTSFIAGKIKNLDVSDNKENSEIISPVISQCSEKFKRHLYQHDLEQILSYPTTPVKKNCKRSPCRRSGRQSNFIIHSLSCETNGLQSKSNPKAPCKAVRTINFWPDQKVDIIKKLYHDAVAVPPIMQILSYLSNEDIHNFSLVSQAWNNIWKSVSDKNRKKKEYEGFLKTAKENQENKNKGVTPKATAFKLVRHLREIHNEMHDNSMKIPCSPPVSPRSNRFRKFTKSASLDSRSQMPCVRCSLPAKVTEEPSGEVWVDCTSNYCLYQFCKFCRCPRHPGKLCFQYDLNGPSPSKRKKNQYAIGTKKSRRNLLRL